ncbi:MAG: c-type cytochrome [Bacteroidales bacterium]|nr:c-type cytochrome [Bacteroidales bacterium]MCF8402449.1 c-type cytochrome [Bacteroidales bacterium]
MKKSIVFFPVLFLSFYIFAISLQAQNAAPAEWAVCSACHTIGKGKLIGPDLKGVNERRDQKWLLSFIKASQTMVQNGDPIAVQLFEEYNKIPMPNNDLTDEQILGILTYIKNYDENAQAETVATAVQDETHSSENMETESAIRMHRQKYGPGNTQPTFIVFIILLIVALVDLIITRIISAKFIHIIIILVSFFVLGEIVYVEAKALGRQEGYSPDQPVWFSHKVHAQQNKINCFYCHSNAMESKSAGIPGTNVCMNCHNVVRSGKQTGTSEIDKVIESWNTGKPIKWVRVHNLPDHVFFSHAQHVNAGKRDCQECHGPVEEIDRITQVNSLGMGWCIRCHRNTAVQFQENGFYQEYINYHEDIKSGKRIRITVDDIGGNNCQTCHY